MFERNFVPLASLPRRSVGVRLMRKRSAIGAAVVGLIGAVVPASSEDAGIYSFIHSEARERSYASPLRVTPQFAPRPLQLTPRQRVTKPAIARAPARAVARVPAKAVAEEPSPKIERDPKTIGEVSNPLPTLLIDETLRPGDMWCFRTAFAYSEVSPAADINWRTS
jgi:hypothetical protein